MSDNIIDLKEKAKAQQAKIAGATKEEPVKTVKRKVFVYFIPFWWRQGNKTGFACYEQPMTDGVEHIGQLMQSAQNYAKQLHINQMAQRKALPWYKFVAKLSISKKQFLIFPLDYRLLREQMEKVPVMPNTMNKDEIN